MSGVHERDRSPTYFAPVDIAADLMDEITKYVMNENRCPKKWRYALGFDLIRKADEIFDSTDYANGIWLTAEHVKERRKYWQRAAGQIRQLDRRLTRFKNVVPTANADNMKEIFRLLHDEKAAISDRLKKERG